MVEGVHGEFDESIRESAGAGPLVPRTRAGTERGEGDPQRGPADRVEHAVQGQPAVLTPGELEIPGVDRSDVLGEHRGGITGMTGVGAIKDEAADRVLEGTVEQGALVKASPGARERALGPGEQGEMGEPQPSLLHRSDTRGQMRSRRAGGDRTSRGGARHPALMADPVDRRVRALSNGFVGGREDRGISGEAEFEEIDAVAEPDEALAELERGDLTPWGGNVGVDLVEEAIEGRQLVLAITHPSIIEHMFVCTDGVVPRRDSPSQPTRYHQCSTLISDSCVPRGRTGFDGVVGRANASRAP